MFKYKRETTNHDVFAPLTLHGLGRGNYCKIATMAANRRKICIFRWNNKLSRLEPEAIVTLGTLYDALRFLLAFRDD